ncbi:hypothetical protein [Tellurirhabdus rosea]|uniref:hypothetical protein n=1 Tax=Tellurirhabdus rosea TaxID=2674997 RepID=UPI00225017A5|nr:hypothetical protein [Tellurirhabdus rosea]
MLKQFFTSLVRRFQFNLDDFGLKEWVVLVYVIAQPLVWARCIDGFDYAWHLLQFASNFAVADLAEHLIGAYQNQTDTKDLPRRIINWGLLVSLGAFGILFVESYVYGL